MNDYGLGPRADQRRSRVSPRATRVSPHQPRLEDSDLTIAIQIYFGMLQVLLDDQMFLAGHGTNWEKTNSLSSCESGS
jgi:hypothetical protein